MYSCGWVLRCREDGTEHFPRTDPAVIMAVRDAQDRLLLARNAHFPTGFHSVLAGFVEPGESLENAVVREVGEEVGVIVEEVEYMGPIERQQPQSLVERPVARRICEPLEVVPVQRYPVGPAAQRTLHPDPVKKVEDGTHPLAPHVCGIVICR